MSNSFDAAIRESLKLVPLSRGDNLLGFEIDLQETLRASSFVKIKVKRTELATCKLIFTCTTTNSSAAVVASSLQRLWIEKLCYEPFEAHALQQESDKVTLSFVTRSGDSDGDLCVTGKIIALGTFT